MMDRIAPETVAEAKTEFDFLRHAQFDRVEAGLDPGIDRGRLRENLVKMAALIPPQDPLSVKTVGAYGSCETRKGCETQVTLEYRFPDRWMLVQLVVHRRDGKSTITEFHLQTLAESLEETYRFTLRGKTALEYAILLMALVAFGLTVYSLVLCIRTPMKRRKWLWILFILVGFGEVEVNWATGEVSHKILHILLLSGGTYGQPYGPVFIMVGLPLGPILFLMLRDRLRKPEIPTPIEERAFPPAETV